MSGFQDNLDAELEKRRETEEVSPAVKTDSKPSMFSFSSFGLGLVLCGLLITALAGYAKLNADKTLNELQTKLPSKTAIVEVVDDNNIENVLTIPRIDASDLNTDIEQDIVTVDDIEPAIAVLPNEEESNINSLTGRPFELYRADFAKKTNKPLLSFIITDLGLSQKKTKSIIENFSQEIGFSFSPYTKDLKTLSQQARQSGHEVWLTLPLETKEYPLNDPGPSTLLVNTSTEKNQARLNSVLGATSEYVGFISPHNHVFKPEDANVNPFIKSIFQKGFAIIDGNNSTRSFVGGLADRNRYPYAQNDIWLDSNMSPLSINQKIRQITEYGDNKRNVIVMLRPYPASLKAVQKFLNSKSSGAFELAPASTQLKNK